MKEEKMKVEHERWKTNWQLSSRKEMNRENIAK
jgi:hypothetical protein